MDNSTNLYSYVMEHLRAKRIPQRKVATDTGVPFSTLAKIAQGRIEDPSVHTIQALADYFREKSREPVLHESSEPVVREAA